MLRSIQPLLLLSLLTVTAVAPLGFMTHSAFAQSSRTLARCNPDEALQSKLAILLDQARSAIDRQDGEEAITTLQAAIPIALQLNYTSFQEDLIQSWLLEQYNGFPTTRLIQLTQQLKSPQRSLALLKQFITLINRLPDANSSTKTLAFVAIARRYAALGQPQTASALITRSRQLEPSIKAPQLRVATWIETAEAYAEIAQPEAAQAVLAQIEKAMPQAFALDASERFKLLERTAILYARLGNSAKAEQVLARLPKAEQSYAIAQVGIVQAYVANGKLDAAEKFAQAIAAPPQKVAAFANLAVAYHSAKNPSKTAEFFRQALTLARSVQDSYVQEQLIQNLVAAYLQTGQLEAALQLTRSLKTPQIATLKAVILAHSQAGKAAQAKVLLSEQLTAITALSDTWEQRSKLWDLIQIAVAAEQFDWIRQEWAQISTIDYGLQDWQILRLAKAYAQTGKYAQAAEWARQLPLENRPTERIKALAAIALVTHRAGETKLANQLLEQTLQAIAPMDQAYRERVNRDGGDLLSLERFKPTALASVAVVYSQTQQPEKTRQILKQVVALSSKIDDPSIANPMDMPFAQFTDTGQYVEALQIAQGTAFPEVQQARLQTSAIGLLSLNRFDLVQPIVKQIRAANSKTQLLLAIAQRYRELNQPQQALPLLAQAFQVAQTIPGDESQLDRLGPEGGTVIDLDNDRGSLLEAIAIQYAQLNRLSDALKVANRLQEEATREQALQKVRCARPS